LDEKKKLNEFFNLVFRWKVRINVLFKVLDEFFFKMQFFIQFMHIDKKNKNDKFKTSILGCKDFLKKEWTFFLKINF
jgi:lipid-A-disaccharide synthase-like uncharacterized protein